MLQIEKNGQTTTDTQKPILAPIAPQLIFGDIVGISWLYKNQSEFDRAYLNAFIQQGIIERQKCKTAWPQCQICF